MTCPECGKKFDSNEFESGNYRPLYNRFLDIINRDGGTTEVPVKCDWCDHQFAIGSFLL